MYSGIFRPHSTATITMTVTSAWRWRKKNRKQSAIKILTYIILCTGGSDRIRGEKNEKDGALEKKMGMKKT